MGGGHASRCEGGGVWVGDMLQGVREVFLCVGGGHASRCEGGGV